MDSETEEDDLMGDDMKMDDGNVETLPTPAPKLKSTIMGGTSWLSDSGPNNTKSSFKKETDTELNSLFTMRKQEFQSSKLVCSGWKSFIVKQ